MVSAWPGIWLVSLYSWLWQPSAHPKGSCTILTAAVNIAAENTDYCWSNSDWSIHEWKGNCYDNALWRASGDAKAGAGPSPSLPNTTGAMQEIANTLRFLQPDPSSAQTRVLIASGLRTKILRRSTGTWRFGVHFWHPTSVLMLKHQWLSVGCSMKLKKWIGNSTA